MALSAKNYNQIINLNNLYAVHNECSYEEGLMRYDLYFRDPVSGLIYMQRATNLTLDKGVNEAIDALHEDYVSAA